MATAIDLVKEAANRHAIVVYGTDVAESPSNVVQRGESEEFSCWFLSEDALPCSVDNKHENSNVQPTRHESSSQNDCVEGSHTENPPIDSNVNPPPDEIENPPTDESPTDESSRNGNTSSENDRNSIEINPPQNRIVLSDSYPKHIENTSGNLLYLLLPQAGNPCTEEPSKATGDSDVSIDHGNKLSYQPVGPIIECGFLPSNAALGSALIVKNVLLPILMAQQSQKLRSPDADLSHFQKFVSRAIELSRNNFTLPLSDLDLTNLDSLVKDDKSIKVLEDLAGDWNEMLSKEMQSVAEMKPIDQDPLSEINFWQNRQSKLSTITDELNEEPILRTREALKLVQSSVSAKLEDLARDAVRLRDEAVDTCRFLLPLEAHFNLISDESFPVALSALPSMLESIRVLWTVSRYFNREERLFPLLKCISWKLANRVKARLDVKYLISRTSRDEAKAHLLEGAQLLDGWRQAYQNMRASIAESGLERRWDFDRTDLFSMTDFVAGVCTDVYGMIDIISTFHLSFGRDLAAVSEEHNNIKDLSTKMKELSAPIISISFDPFDERNRDKWNETVDAFHQNVKQTESYTQTCIERAFHNLCSAEGAFVLIEKYRQLECRPPIQRRIEDRYENILERYLYELDLLERKFSSSKECPPISDYPRTAGAIAWADGLYRSAKQPMLRFIKCCDGMLSSDLGVTAKSRYLNFARSIDTYKNDVATTWESHLNEQLNDGLRKCVLTRVQKNNRTTSVEGAVIDGFDFSKSVCDSTSTKKSRKSNLTNPFVTTKLESNFPQQVLQIFEEVKHMEHLGFRIPNFVTDFVSLEGQYHQLIESVNSLANRYNHTIATVTEYEASIVLMQLENLNRSFQPGLSKLNWMSQRINAFVDAGNHALEVFSSILAEVRKHSYSINVVVAKFEESTLIERSDFLQASPMSMVQFCNTVQERVEIRTKDLLDIIHRSMKPFLVKIEMSVSESSRGSSTHLRDFYFYWEKRIHNALAQVLVRSLANFDFLVCSNSCVCKIEVSLSGSDITMSPTMRDVYKLLNRCIRAITHAPKKFLRWMSGTCLEATIEPNEDDIFNAPQSVSFHEALSRNDLIVGCLVILNRDLHVVLREVERRLSNLKQFKDRIASQTIMAENPNKEISLSTAAMMLSAIPRGEEIGHPMLSMQSSCSTGFIQVDYSKISHECEDMVNKFVSAAGSHLITAIETELNEIESQIDRCQTIMFQDDELKRLDVHVQFTIHNIHEHCSILQKNKYRELWGHKLLKLISSVEKVLAQWNDLLESDEISSREKDGLCEKNSSCHDNLEEIPSSEGDGHCEQASTCHNMSEDILSSEDGQCEQT